MSASICGFKEKFCLATVTWKAEITEVSPPLVSKELKRHWSYFACGPAYIIIKARQGELTRSDFASGYGMSIIAAVSGACISIRHILLHIVPPDPGYGSPMFGLHLYTWALIVFAAVLVVSGLNLIFIRELEPRKVLYRWPSKVVIGLFGTVIVANVVGVFFEEGFHWTLPDNPVRYQLLYDLGLLKEAQESL